MKLLSSKSIGQVLLLPQSYVKKKVVRSRISKHLIFVASTTIATKVRSRYTKWNSFVIFRASTTLAPKVRNTYNRFSEEMNIMAMRQVICGNNKFSKMEETISTICIE